MAPRVIIYLFVCLFLDRPAHLREQVLVHGQGYSETIHRRRKQSIKEVTTNIRPQFLLFPLASNAAEDSIHLSLSFPLSLSLYTHTNFAFPSPSLHQELFNLAIFFSL